MLACCLLQFTVHFGGVVNICNEFLTFCNQCHHSADRIVVQWHTVRSIVGSKKKCFSNAWRHTLVVLEMH